MNVEVTLALGSINIHLPGKWTTESILRDVVNNVKGAVVQRVTVGSNIVEESDFESTTLGSLLSDESTSLLIQISEKKVKTDNDGIEDSSLRKLLEDGILPLNYDNRDLISSTHTDHTGHKDAQITTFEIGLKKNAGNKDIGVDDKTRAMGSILLLQKKEGSPELRYLTEADIRSLVVFTVKDALRLALGRSAADEYDVHYEVSLFSFGPDIVVIRHKAVGISLVLKVKKPGSNVFTSEEVAGQVNTYGMGLLSSGIVAPFVILSSYDGMCITFPKRCLEACVEIMNKNIDNLGSPFADPLGTVEVQAFSDLTQVFSATSTSEEDAGNAPLVRGGGNGDESDEDAGNAPAAEGWDDEDDEFDEDYEPPSVVYSQLFKGRDVVPALILAIRCGVDALAQKRPRLIPLHSASAEGICALANAKAIVWKDIPTNLLFNYIDFPGTNTKKFYLWTSLGRGSSGRVFLGCSLQGKVCAIKFFFIDDKEILKYPKEERPAARERAKRQKKIAAKRERDMWRKAYDDKRVVVRELNNSWLLDAIL